MCFCEPRQEVFSPQTAILLQHGFQPKLDRLPQWKRSEIAKTLLFRSKIHVANSGSYLRLTRKAEGSEFSKNSPSKLGESARTRPQRQNWCHLDQDFDPAEPHPGADEYPSRISNLNRSKIHNVANRGSYLRLTRKTEGSEFSENSTAKLDASARAGSPTSDSINFTLNKILMGDILIKLFMKNVTHIHT